MPIVKISYVGYFPPKCTCHDKQSHPSNYMNLLECLHDHPCPDSSPTPSHMPKSNASKISNFQNKSFLFSKTHYRISVNTLDCPPRRIAGYFFETVMVLIRSDLLNNSPRQFFGKSSLKFLSQTFSFFFQFHVMHSLLILYGALVHMECMMPISTNSC